MRWGNAFRRNSITYRQMRLVLSAALTVGGLIFLVEAAMLAASARDSLIKRQEQIVALAERPATSAVWEFNDRLAAETLAGVMQAPDVRLAMIVHPDGMPFASEARAGAQPPLWKRFLGGLIVGSHERIAIPLSMPNLVPGRDDRAIGSLIVVFDVAAQADMFVGVLSGTLSMRPWGSSASTPST